MTMANAPATLLSCNGLNVWIVVDNEELELYGLEENEENVSSCWIASETDKTFVVKVSPALPPTDDYAVWVYLDGTRVGGATMLRNCVERLWTIRSKRVSRTEVTDFMFGALELTDDDAYLERNALSENVGEIKVMFYRVQGTHIRHKWGVAKYTPDADSQASKIHERSKKALAHRVKFSEARQEVENQHKFSIISKELLATVIFKYRPLAMLQANGIVQYVPPAEEADTSLIISPEPSSRKRKEVGVKPEIDNDEDGDEEEVSPREKALLAELERVRKEEKAKRDADRPKKKAKKEPTSNFIPGEVIDLTI